MNKDKSQFFRQGPQPQKAVVGSVESIFREDQVRIAELHQPGVVHAPAIQLLWRPNFGMVWVPYQLGVTVLR